MSTLTGLGGTFQRSVVPGAQRGESVAQRRPNKKAAGPWKARILIAPGLEAALVTELDQLGITAFPEKGAALAQLDAAAMDRLHRHSRLSARVTVHLGTVGAQSLDMLADRTRKLPWSRYVHPNQPLEVRVTAHKSRLRNRDAVGQKVKFAVTDALRGPRRPGPRPPREPAIVFVRIDQDKATIQMDASGELLHRRGWRHNPGGAPIRENIAAAVLQLAGWRPGIPLDDPMTGSGTFAIEAAQWAMAIPCGDRRSYGYQRWPCWVAPAPQRSTDVPDRKTTIIAADREQHRVTGAQQNARRAGVHGRIQWHHGELEERSAPPGPPGLVVLNPPWGERLGSREAVAGLHARWSRHLQHHWPTWNVAVVAPDAGWPRKAWGSQYTTAVKFSSGGQRVMLLTRPACTPDDLF
ncbi:MAG: putative N6-adenine-specific DNA methylase [Kiritimatiellia bacterium]